MYRLDIALPLVVSLATAPAIAAGVIMPQAAGRARFEIEDLSVEAQPVEPGQFAFVIRFRRPEGSGELRIDLWNGSERSTMEAWFSFADARHVFLRQVEGSEDHEVWLSPALERELAHDSLALMNIFWAVLADPRVHAQVTGWLATLPPDPAAKNPACGVTKWGLKAIVWIAGAACCSGSFGVLCATCAVGGGTALDAIDGIDCDKECKRDCPIA